MPGNVQLTDPFGYVMCQSHPVITTIAMRMFVLYQLVMSDGLKSLSYKNANFTNANHNYK